MHTRRRHGFTLIELLVVVAIIAILAAILFPIFAAVESNARVAKCQSHQKELVQALMLYTDAWHGDMPYIQFLTWTDFYGTLGGYAWIHEVRLYEPYVRNFDILLCPQKYPYVIHHSDGTTEVTYRYQGYAYNEILCGPLKSGKPSGRFDVRDMKKRYGRPYSDIRRPSRTPAFFCAMSHHDAPGDYGINGWGWQPQDALNEDRMKNAHNGAADYAFLDGHVKLLKPAGGGMLMATDGLDYDGNGTLGDSYMMR
jgi:prepilin-type N-terminal cleavage/methylation domain-containing protein/prepilin-type processing-associated H-X9-DG protein